MNCLDKNMINKLAKIYFPNKLIPDVPNTESDSDNSETSDFPITEVTEIHSYTLDYELHIIVKLDLYLDSYPEEYITLFIDNVSSLIIDNNDQYAFIHADSQHCFISDNNKHLVYDYSTGTVLPYQEFESYHDLSKHSFDEYPW